MHSVRFILILVLSSVLAILPIPTSRADCTYIYHVDTDPELVCTPDLYYTELSSVPNWCAYGNGDGVFLKFNHNIANAPIDAYYFVTADDWNATAPAGFDPYRFYVYHNPYTGCGYSF